MWHCPFDVSFAAHTPQWERILLPKEVFAIDGRSWSGRHSIWSVRDMVKRDPRKQGAGTRWFQDTNLAGVCQCCL